LIFSLNSFITGVEPAELPETAVDCEVFRVVLGLLPRDAPQSKSIFLV